MGIYGICSIIKFVLFLDCIKFGFELINQKIFEIQIKNLAT
jgi:hypothetical protein